MLHSNIVLADVPNVPMILICTIGSQAYRCIMANQSGIQWTPDQQTCVEIGLNMHHLASARTYISIMRLRVRVIWNVKLDIN